MAFLFLFFAVEKGYNLNLSCFLMELPSYQIFLMDKLKCFYWKSWGDRSCTCAAACQEQIGENTEAVGIDGALT